MYLNTDTVYVAELVVQYTLEVNHLHYIRYIFCGSHKAGFLALSSLYKVFVGRNFKMVSNPFLIFS